MPVLLLGRMIVGIGNAYQEMNYCGFIELRRDLLGYIELTTVSHCSGGCLIEPLMVTMLSLATSDF